MVAVASLIAAEAGLADVHQLELPALAARHSADTCGTGRRRTGPPPRRRCRRALRGWRCARPPRPWAGASAAPAAPAPARVACKRDHARPRPARASPHRSLGSASMRFEIGQLALRDLRSSLDRFHHRRQVGIFLGSCAHRLAASFWSGWPAGRASSSWRFTTRSSFSVRKLTSVLVLVVQGPSRTGGASGRLRDPSVGAAAFSAS